MCLQTIYFEKMRRRQTGLPCKQGKKSLSHSPIIWEKKKIVLNIISIIREFFSCFKQNKLQKRLQSLDFHKLSGRNCSYSVLATFDISAAHLQFTVALLIQLQLVYKNKSNEIFLHNHPINLFLAFLPFELAIKPTEFD